MGRRMERESVLQRPGNKAYHFRGTKERFEVNLYRSVGLHGLQVDNCTFSFTLLILKYPENEYVTVKFIATCVRTQNCTVAYTDRSTFNMLQFCDLHTKQRQNTPFGLQGTIYECVTMCWGNLWAPTGEQFYIVYNDLHFGNKLDISAHCACVW